MRISILLLKSILTLFIFLCLFPELLSAQWSAPVCLSPVAVSAALNESMGPCLGVSEDTLHVVWTDKLSTTRARIYYTRSLDTGLTWSAPIALTDTSSNAWNPAIAVNGRNIHVVWREVSTVNGHRASWYKHSLDGGNTWGPNIYLDSTADWPAVTVSGNRVYVANDLVTAASPYNTEIFFLRSIDNGLSWSAPQQLTFAVNRSEDEAISAQGSHVHMSWNDKRTGQFQIFYKESSDYGVTWGPDVVVDTPFDYSTMVSVDGAHVDVIAAGAPAGHYQILLTQSADTGVTWGSSMDITNDTAHTFFYPFMVRNDSDLHVVCGSSIGGQYLHSADGGATWDAPFTFTGGSTFIAYTGCVLHILYLINTDHHVYYMRNPTGNAEHCDITTGILSGSQEEIIVNAYPNPFTDKIILESSKDLGLIKIFDNIGSVVWQQQNNSQQAQLNLSNVSSGIYILSIAGKFIKIIKE
jgi:hypothetical protein